MKNTLYRVYRDLTVHITQCTGRKISFSPHTSERLALGPRSKYDRQSRRATQTAARVRTCADEAPTSVVQDHVRTDQNAERAGGSAEAPPNGERDSVRGRAAGPPLSQTRMRRRASSVANQTIANPPPAYRASGRPATKAVMDRHMETITSLVTAGKARQQDVANLSVLFDVYDMLPPRPNGILEG
jgi:hypothetical protein